MTLYLADSSFDASLFAGASVAFGVFDGLHEGHRYLIDRALATRGANGGAGSGADGGTGSGADGGTGSRAVVLTFDKDPDEVFHPDRLKKLMRNQDRLRALEATGADAVVVLPFVPELYSQAPNDFLASTFSAGAPAHLHVGEDFRFGARAAGTVDTLRMWGAGAGCIVHAHHLVAADGKPITATRIRLLLLDCSIAEANRLLGHPYTLCETVRPGRGQGTGFGFATANLQVKPHDRVLGEGVYAAYATVDGVRYKAAVSVGVSPTFEATSVANMEVHILDFQGDLAGREIAVAFMAFLRPMRKFSSTEELIATVTANIQQVRELLD